MREGSRDNYSELQLRRKRYGFYIPTHPDLSIYSPTRKYRVSIVKVVHTHTHKWLSVTQVAIVDAYTRTVLGAMSDLYVKPQD